MSESESAIAGRAATISLRATGAGLVLLALVALSGSGGLPSSKAPAALAAPLYEQGRERLRQLDGVAAREVLKQAVADAPADALAWAALAEAHRLLGEDAPAAAAGGTALERLAGLGQRDRQLVEALAASARGDREKSLAAFAALFAADPADVDAGCWLATAQNRQGQSQAALQTLELLRRLPPPAGEDPRIDYTAAAVLLRLGDVRASRAAAERAAAAAGRAGAPLLAAKCRLTQALALRKEGQRSAAAIVATLADAAAIFAASGDPKSLAPALVLEAGARQTLGDLRAAGKLYAEALATYRRLGDRVGQGDVLIAQGVLAAGAEKDRLRGEGLALYRAAGARSKIALAALNAGVSHHWKGDLLAARQAYDEALQLLAELGDQATATQVKLNLAELHGDRGEAEKALAMLAEALELYRGAGNDRLIAYDLLRTGQVSAARGDLVLARDSYQEATARAGDHQAIGEETRVALADLLLAQGDPEAAERLAIEAEEALLLGGDGPLAGRADVALTRALLARGKHAGARATSRQAGQLAAGSGMRDLQFSAAVAQKLVAAVADGNPAAALAELEELRQDAAGRGQSRLAGEAAAAAAAVAARP